jgi:thioredoxin
MEQFEMKRYFIIFFIFTLFSCKENTSNVISAQEFREKINKDKSAIIIDVRTPEEFNKGHLRNALNVNWFDGNFEENVSIFNKNLPIYVYCLSGGRSSKANKIIKSIGFDKVHELNGGILEWRKNQFPEASINNDYNNSLTVKDFNKLIDSDKIVLVDYYANWCAPCKIMEPYLVEISHEYSKNLNLVRINYDENLPLLRSLEVYGLPVLQLYKDKKLLWSNVGFIEKSSVESEIKKNL